MALPSAFSIAESMPPRDAECAIIACRFFLLFVLLAARMASPTSTVVDAQCEIGLVRRGLSRAPSWSPGSI